MTHNSTDFHLPDEILSVIPTDPYEQLDLARKITSMAIASRVSKLELETVRLRQKITEKDRMVYELEEKLMQLEQAFQESESQLRVVLEENVQLSKERDSLAATTKKLNRDLSKLETFKRQLMQSLNNDNLSQAETVDIGTCDQSVSKKGAEINSSQASNLLSGSAESENSNIDGLRNAGRRFSMPQYITPRYTPTGTPNLVSTGGSPRGYSAAGSPRISSRATSPPTKVQFEGQTGLSPWYSSSQQSSAANSPPRGHPLPGRTPRIDGKEFFRQARSRLSYEQFSAFLANIKELNSQKQSREDTLKKAEEIFGRDNKDLYVSFQGLLGRNANYN